MDEKLKEAYKSIIKTVELPFYNDVFMKYIISYDIHEEVRKSDENLVIKPQYKNLVMHGSYLEDRHDFFELSVENELLKNEKTRQITRNHLMNTYNIYRDM